MNVDIIKSLNHNGMEINSWLKIVSGYNGTFAFEKPGDPYLDHNYLGMRIVCTVMGAALVPLRLV